MTKIVNPMIDHNYIIIKESKKNYFAANEAWRLAKLDNLDKSIDERINLYEIALSKIEEVRELVPSLAELAENDPDLEGWQRWLYKIYIETQLMPLNSWYKDAELQVTKLKSLNPGN